ncbi:FHA domain-containing protein [Streptomyces sp. NPDC058953]|uniref:FHA domain-containing protein n=1 Tax=unclassified Streptomyces TaxID=2593676 RepID=UPI0036CD55AA
MTSSLPSPSPGFSGQPVPLRPSDAERDRAVDVLKEGAAAGRISHDTFVRRMELALAARSPEELKVLTADLRADDGLSGRVVRSVGGVSAFLVRLRRAWAAEKLPPLLFPEPGPHPLRIGRDPGSGLRLTHESVSRMHAELIPHGPVWVLRDLGSMNGTTVNGLRVTGSVPVRDGDVVSFGQIAFRLTKR